MDTALQPLAVDFFIPYCVREERFRSSAQLIGSNEEKDAYISALKRELLSYSGSLEGYEVLSLRFSGGCATVMSPDLLGDLMKTAREVLPVARGAECSVDADPYTIGTPALTGIASGHPNRMELRMRSSDDGELHALGCAHTMQHVNNAVLFFNRFHVNNFGLTVDIGIPGQSEASWESTLNAVKIIRPSHVRFDLLHVSGEEALPVDTRFALYSDGCMHLREAGYLQYSASCFCLPQHASYHELLYLDAAERIGLGLGAVTMMDGYLTRNTNNRHIYLAHAGDYEKTSAEVFAAGREIQMELFLRRALLSAAGLEKQKFCRRFGCEIPKPLLQILHDRLEDGLLEESDSAWVPTLRGLFSAASEEKP